MTGAEILGIVAGIFKFWDQVVWLIKTLKDTPEESREKLMISVKEEIEKFQKTGRPTWD